MAMCMEIFDAIKASTWPNYVFLAATVVGELGHVDCRGGIINVIMPLCWQGRESFRSQLFLLKSTLPLRQPVGVIRGVVSKVGGCQ